MLGNRALFLDRDGVINKDYGYISKVSDIDFVDGIFPLVRYANELGFLVLIITNQAGVAHGYFEKTNFHKLMNWIVDEFKEQSCKIDDYFACFTHPDAKVPELRRLDYRRKPGPGMILEAAEKHNVNLSRSIFIGDQFTDVLAGLHAGVGKTYLLDCDINTQNLPNNVSVISTLKQVFIEL